MSPCPLAAGRCTKMSSLLAFSLLWIGPATNGISHIQSARPIRPLEVEPLQLLHPRGLASGQALLFLQVHSRVMISDECELVLADSLQIALPNLHGMHCCETLLLRDCVIELSWYHLPGFKSQGAPICKSTASMLHSLASATTSKALVRSGALSTGAEVRSCFNPSKAA